MDLDTVIARLKAEPNKQVVADATGLRYMYVWRLSRGKMKRPSVQRIDKIREYFAAKDKR